MPVPVQQTALLRFLKKKNASYYGRILDLRDAAGQWLAYVPQTYAHYTLHGVDHSDEIIRQVSKLLFRGTSSRQAVVDLSAAEVYILAAAAYLHDVGMVVPEGEKLRILTSEDWREWVTTSSAADRFSQAQALRDADVPADPGLRHFLADLQTRFLISEYVRRTHHLRSAKIIAAHPQMLGRVGFADPVLVSTISDVCAAHGARTHELNDNERYPVLRDVDGQPVNVQFLAILLRLGDLLDITYDRACPLLMNAACPLPAESYAHWSMYQRVVHRSTSPHRIAVTAECENQEEHRLWQDWCLWLISEIKEAGVVTAQADRHGEWRPPKAILGESVVVRPKIGARYFFSEWRFELDQDAVFDRLVRDVYDHPLAFVRELIQNALDATRCQMHQDLRNEGIEAPQYPTQVEAERRQRYPIHVSLESRQVPNELSGQPEERQVLVVEDDGIGMDSSIIEHYLLQVGRSYYTTEEFRRSFGFVPMSRFGIGFLSVFGASEHVVVETYKPRSGQANPIRLTLTGPRNYLLTEHGARRSNGTRVEILLREPIEPGRLTEAVSYWCKRVEFPVVVQDLGTETLLASDRLEDDLPRVPDVGEAGAYLVVRVLPIARPGVEGELYVLTHVDSRGESWAAANWAMYTYLAEHPLAALPELPRSYVCLHGVRTRSGTGYGYDHDQAAGAQLDIRRDIESLTTSREVSSHRSFGLRQPLQNELDSEWEAVLTDHLARSARAVGEDRWKYCQRLMKYFPLGSFWASVSGTIRIHDSGDRKLVSLRDIVEMPVIWTTLDVSGPRWSGDARSAPSSYELVQISGPCITDGDLAAISKLQLPALFAGRLATSTRFLSRKHLAISWSLADAADRWTAAFPRPTQAVSLPDTHAIAVAIHKTTDTVYEGILLNAGHPFVAWAEKVHAACACGTCGLSDTNFERLAKAIEDAARYQKIDLLGSYLESWREIRDLPPELVPPDEHLRSAFRLRLPEGESG